MGWEVRLEIQHGTVLVEDGAEGVQLVTRGVAGGVVEFQEELVVRHIVQSNEAKRTETARFCSNRGDTFLEKLNNALTIFVF